MRASGVRPRLCGLLGGHQHERGGAVIDARRVAGRDRAFLREGGRSLASARSSCRGADIFVLVDDDVALAGRDREGDDLVLELAGLLAASALFCEATRERVLLVAGDLPLGGDVLGGRAHVVAVEGVEQAVLQHGVDELHVAHLGAAAQVRGVLRHRHRFLAARDDDRGVAIGDLLHAERDGAQARAAELVEAPGGGFLRDAGLHGGLAGRVLALAGGQDLAEDDLVDLAAVDLGALQRAP